jgi:hypothetical protein
MSHTDVVGQPRTNVDSGSHKDYPEADIAIGNKFIGSNITAGVFSGNNNQNYRIINHIIIPIALLINQFGIGILSISGTLKTFGLIPRLIFIISIGPIT